jgi:type I restriction enzyme S subunit
MTSKGPTRLADVAEVLMGQSPPGNTYNQLGQGRPLLNGPTEFGASHPTPTLWTTAPTKLCQRGDLLFCVRGSTTGRMNWADQPYCIGRGVAALRGREAPIDTRFLFYVISKELDRLLSRCAGSVFPNLSRNDLQTFEVTWPTRKARELAVHILGALDDKIELNRRMNETLEALARAIFKSWFVDFDPVCAKAAGRQPFGMNTQTAALFPSSFEDSLIGKIPRGWKVSGVDQIANFLNGLALQKFPAEGADFLPAIKIAQLRRGSLGEADRVSKNIPSDYVVHDGDVLFSWSGSLEVVVWCGGPGALNQHLFKVSSSQYPKWFFYNWILEHLSDFQHIAAGKATTMGHIQRHHLSDAKVVVPPEPLIVAADRIMGPIFQRRICSSLESRTLTSIRDALLPKLVSGEIRVQGTQKMVEASS